MRCDGLDFELIRSVRSNFRAKISEGRLTVFAPISASDEDVCRFLRKHRRWAETNLARARERMKKAQVLRPLTEEELRDCRRRAQAVIPGRVAYFAPLVGVRCGKISIRCQKTLWGSCTAKGNLSFNCLLMLAPPEVLDCVIVHELCHRKYMDHSPRFYAELQRVFPDWRKCQKWLKENGELLQRRAPQ